MIRSTPTIYKRHSAWSITGSRPSAPHSCLTEHGRSSFTAALREKTRRPRATMGLHRLDARGLLTLRTLIYIELHTLVFLQRFEPINPDFREMSEQIISCAVQCNEAESLCIVEPLHSTFCHFPGPSVPLKSSRDEHGPSPFPVCPVQSQCKSRLSETAIRLSASGGGAFPRSKAVRANSGALCALETQEKSTHSFPLLSMHLQLSRENPLRVGCDYNVVWPYSSCRGVTPNSGCLTSAIDNI